LPHFEPINDSFLALGGEPCYVQIAYALSMSGVNTVEYILDAQFDALPGTTDSIMGALVLGPPNQHVALTLSATGFVQFVVQRGGSVVAQSAAGVIVPGLRYILRGVDDGVTVRLYINGTLMDSLPAGTGPISNLGTPAILIGRGLGVYNKMRIFGAQVRQDGIVTVRFLPREKSGSTLRDLSGYNQAITIQGGTVEGTNFWWGSAWNREPMFTGGVTL
jgi:hypothetical protein